MQNSQVDAICSQLVLIGINGNSCTGKSRVKTWVFKTSYVRKRYLEPILRSGSVMNTQLFNFAVDHLLGKPTWNVAPGYGSFITLNFGKPLLVTREPIIGRKENLASVNAALAKRKISVVGEYHLWVYCSKWEIRNQENVFASNDSDSNDIALACERLDGLILNEFSFDTDTLITYIYFENELSLIISPDDLLKSDQWILFVNDKNYSMSHDGELIEETSKSGLQKDRLGSSI